MNWLDMAILVVLAGFLAKGLFRGLLKELCSLLGLFGGIFVAVRFNPWLAEGLIKVFRVPETLGKVLAFILLFLFTVLLFAVLGFVLSRFVSLLFLGGFNRVAGGLFGLLEGGLLLTLVLYGLSHCSRPEALRQALRGSELAPPLVELGERLLHKEGRGKDSAPMRTTAARI
ncbi:CvpA family protein [Desulfuromonas sp. CSMB_57]|uniref:CvpA family protein n=1 Tax=Desulfuromonas sp. CSMB_57 TaxID=2807629 RepID=UPI001CD3AF4E